MRPEADFEAGLGAGNHSRSQASTFSPVNFGIAISQDRTGPCCLGTGPVSGGTARNLSGVQTRSKKNA